VPARSFEDAAGVLSWLEQKIATATLLPVSHGEVRTAMVLFTVTVALT
jgi:hypothetical protein